MDWLATTDPMAVLQEKVNGCWRVIDHTEVITGKLSPEWVKAFDVPYKFEEVQVFRVSIYCIEDRHCLDELDK